MKHVDKFFGLKPGETQVCNGFTFVCTGKKVLTQGAAPTIYGTLTTPEGTVVDYTQKGIFANKLNKIAGVANKVVFKSKVDNSQQTGEHKVVSATLSASKQQKRFMKAWRAMLQVHRIYCPDATDIPAAMWDALTAEDAWYNHIEKIKAQQAIEAAKAKAEAEAIAEARAKMLQKAVDELTNMVENFVQCGMSYKQAEELVRNNPNYTDEQKEAAFSK